MTVFRATTLAFLAACAMPAAAADLFQAGNLVVAVSGNGVWGSTSGSYTTNQASPLTLMQFSHVGTSSAAYVNSLVLPQASSGANSVISAEYGSSSEGFLHLSGDGRYLTTMGYGVNAATFNANPTAYGTLTTDPTKSTALAQSGSLTGQAYTPVARVAALVSADGTVDTSTALYNIYNGQNPRAVYTLDGRSLYVSGQGTSGDQTGGVFYAQRGAASATPVTGLDTSSKTAAQDTRDVQVYNNQLYVSVDSKQGSGSNRDFVGTLGTIGNLPTSLANSGNGPTPLTGFTNTPGSGMTGRFLVTPGNTNGINMPGQTINLSPEQFFFANATTLYVADSGMPKNDSATNVSGGVTYGNGGLQKWVFANGSWSLAYTLAAGLNLVRNDAASGVTGLFGLTGLVNGDTVELYATSATKGETDQSYIYGISDSLAARANAGTSFTTLAAAPVNSNFRGISFAPSATAPVPEPASWMMMIGGFGMLGVALRRRRVRFA